MTDTTLLVIRAAKTPYPFIRRAVEAIGRERIFGVVLNCADEAAGSGGYSYYSYYDSYSKGEVGRGGQDPSPPRLVAAVPADRLRERADRRGRGVRGVAALPAPAAWDLMAIENGWWKAVLVAAVCQMCLYYADLYDLRVVADRRELFVRALQSLGAASLILAVLYYLFPDLLGLGRGVFMIAAAFVVVIIVGWRVAFDWLARHARPTERLLLVGTGVAAADLAVELHDRRAELGVEIVGFVDADRSAGGAVAGEPRRSSGRSTTSRRSCATATWTASWSAWPTRAASCRWTRCST